MAKRSLILGVTGQDGAYLAAHLLSNGHEIWGTSRDLANASLSGLDRLQVRDRVTLRTLSLTEFSNIVEAINEINPDEIYYLAGQSSVELSFREPAATLQSSTSAIVNLLEALRLFAPECRFYNAGSSEIFGNTPPEGAIETSQINPRSPYGVGKACAFLLTRHYREAYGLHACTGLLFNHESPLRPERFVTQKVVQAALRIAQGQQERLPLGNLEVVRDWGWAPDYVAAMAMMLNGDPDDFIIATGKQHSLEEFVAAAFAYHGLDWHDHVDSNAVSRPTDIVYSRGWPAAVSQKLGWSASHTMPDIVRLMSEDASLSAAAPARPA